MSVSYHSFPGNAAARGGLMVGFVSFARAVLTRAASGN
jgi:hypothetical protein